MIIVNPMNITTGKANYKLIQGQGKKIASKPKTFKNKEEKKKFSGEGFKELTDKLKKMKVKDTMKDIRITM